MPLWVGPRQFGQSDALAGAWMTKHVAKARVDAKIIFIINKFLQSGLLHTPNPGHFLPRSTRKEHKCTSRAQPCKD
jgi:hypothetical protein